MSDKDKYLSPNSFQGLPWESWTDSLGHLVPKAEKPLEPKLPDKNRAGVMKLPKEDSKSFGLCPERDPFTVVVCETCNMCVKQQALAEHIDKRHLKKDSLMVILTLPNQPTVLEKSRSSSKAVKPVVQNLLAKVKRKRIINKEFKNKKAVVNSVPSLPVSLLLEERDTIHVAEPVTPNMELPQPVITLNPLPATKHTTKAGRAPRMVSVKQRIYDPDKHCGVVRADTMKPCTWSLTCKSHSMGLRRAVVGRSKPFHQLLADHRKVKEVLIKQKKNLELQNSSVMLTPPSSQPQEKSQKELLLTELVNATMRSSSTASPLSGSVKLNSSSTKVVHIGLMSTISSPPTAVPVSKVKMSWKQSQVPGVSMSVPLVCQLPELNLDVRPAKRLFLSSQPQGLIVNTLSPDKPPPSLPLPIWGSVSSLPPNQIETLSVSPHPPRPLNVPPIFSKHKIGGLLYSNRRMQVVRQGMETCLLCTGNGLTHSKNTILGYSSSKAVS